MYYLHRFLEEFWMQCSHSIDSMRGYNTKMCHVDLFLLAFLNQWHASYTIHITWKQLLHSLSAGKLAKVCTSWSQRNNKYIIKVYYELNNKTVYADYFVSKTLFTHFTLLKFETEFLTWLQEARRTDQWPSYLKTITIWQFEKI